MAAIVARINIPEGSPKTLSLKNIDFEESVLYLRQEIGRLINVDFRDIEILHKGILLDDNLPLNATVQPDDYIFCFLKPNSFKIDPVPSPTPEEKHRAQDSFSLTSHIQLNVNSRINILQKLLHEYPEFRFNMGAHALIRDSVLFNTVHISEVIENLAHHYAIICKAAPFIVDTIKKELKKSSASVSEPTTDATSDDETSLGASSNSDRNLTESFNRNTNRTSNQVSRQQLESALAFALGARNSTAAGNQQSSEYVPNAASDSGSSNNVTSTSSLISAALERSIQDMNRTSEMDTSNAAAPMDTDSSVPESPASNDETGDVIPAHYRSHQYAEQLRTMAQMGFLNYEENLTYLNIANGNIENAVNLLMGIMN